MVLRKPYAFFIKMFKPIHFMLAVLVVYLIYLENKILNFLNVYIYSSSNVVGEKIKDALVSNFLYFIPIIIMLFSLVILGIMFRKKKPIKFYVVNVFAFIVVIIINLYASNFLGVLEEHIVAIKTVKLIHDLVLINIIIESISFIFLVVRGMGVNFKKFDFDSEISKFNVNESDKEEFELDINLDLDESKRKRKKKIRFLKYAYIENKFLINSVAIIIVCVIALVVYGTISIYNKENKEGVVYSASTFNFGVDETIILNTGYQGEKLTDNYLIVVNTNIKANFSSKSLYLNDFSLKIGEAIFKPTTKYSNSLVDLGNLYDESILPLEFTNYLFVYEIPEKYIASDMLFSYNNEGRSIDIKLNPKNVETNDFYVSKKINEEISFAESLGDIRFKINDYEIKDKFILEYNYCVKNNDCILSYEYIKASIDKNFDKYVLRLNVEYSANSDLNVSSFYKFFSKFGIIYYNINDTWYYQKGNFEEIKSSKVSDKNTVYIGINSEIINATSIKLVFNIRGSKYEYLLK